MILIFVSDNKPQPKSVWIPTKTPSSTQTSSATGKSNVIFDELKDVKVAKKDEQDSDNSSYDSYRGGATGITHMQVCLKNNRLFTLKVHVIFQTYSLYM